MIIRIDPASPEPLFEQVVFAVKAAVAKGSAAAGDKLPSVRELARELAINPNTVVRAYDALERDGVIVRRQGAGCFLTDQGSGQLAPTRWAHVHQASDVEAARALAEAAPFAAEEHSLELLPWDLSQRPPGW